MSAAQSHSASACSGLSEREGGDLDSVDTADSDLDPPAMEGSAAPHLFPSDEYISLVDSLNQVHVSNFAPQQLIRCLKASEAIVRQGDRFVQPPCAQLGYAYVTPLRLRFSGAECVKTTWKG